MWNTYSYNIWYIVYCTVAMIGFPIMYYIIIMTHTWNAADIYVMLRFLHASVIYDTGYGDSFKLSYSLFKNTLIVFENVFIFIIF